MSDDNLVALTAKQIRGLLTMAMLGLLLVIMLGFTLRGDRSRQPSAASESGRTGDVIASLDPQKQQEIIDMFLGGGSVSTNDRDALRKSLGEPVLLTASNAVVQVTADRIGGGTRPCASEPLIIIDLAVEPQSGTAALPPADFHLMAADGTVAEPLQNCLTGFAERSTRRSLAFAGVEPDRLVYGKDPLRPVAVWLLS